MAAIARHSMTAICMLGLTGCMAGTLGSHATKKTPDTNSAALLEAYRAAAEAASQAPDQKTAGGIRVLEVARDGNGTQLVTVDLEAASLSEVVKRLMAATGSGFVARSRPRGSVTARFNAMPLAQALDLLLSTNGYRAWEEAGVIVIDAGRPSGSAPPSPAPSSGAGPPPGAMPGAPPGMGGDASASATLPLRWLDGKGAGAIIAGLYPSAMGGVPAVRFGMQPNTNTVYLVGGSADVERAAAVLREADRPPDHVLIEAFIVELHHDAFSRISANVKNGAKGSLSAVNLLFGLINSPAVTFTHVEGANNNKQFTALIDLIALDQDVRVISRPRIATLSGVEASLGVTREELVFPLSPTPGSYVSPVQVSSGVTLNIVPTVTTSGLVRTQLSIEDSQFVPSAQNVAVEKEKNTANTTMLVEDGESIVIGGLVLNGDHDSNAGVPFLRRIPGLRYLFGDQERNSNRVEVLLVITPHIYDPSMSPQFTPADLFDGKQRGAE